MWLELERALSARSGLEQVLPQLQALAVFADELDARIGADGVGGALALHRRLAELLGSVSHDDLARVVQAVDAVSAALEVVRRDVERVRRLKAALGV